MKKIKENQRHEKNQGPFQVWLVLGTISRYLKVPRYECKPLMKEMVSVFQR